MIFDMSFDPIGIPALFMVLVKVLKILKYCFYSVKDFLFLMHHVLLFHKSILFSFT